MESKNDFVKHGMNTQIIIKQEPCFLDRTLTAVKFKSEVTCGSDVQVKNESASFASVFIVQSDSNIHKYYHETNANIQIKEEPCSLEGISSPLNSGSEEVHLKDVDVQDDTLEGDEFILPESSRLDKETVWNRGTGATSAILDKGCLKLRENSNLCRENSNTGAADGSDVRETAHMDHRKSYKCIFCGESFSQALDLQTHIAIHEHKKKHKCTICEKRFVTASRLKRHSFIHEGIRPFKCDKCEKSFTISSNLSRHKLYHEGKRPHKCDVCEKTFTEASHLKTHNLIHEGKRPFKCDKCDKSFTTSSNLKTHNLFHEGKKPHKCKICEKSYIIASHLKNHHKLVHEGKKPQKSEISEKSFILGC